MRLLFLLPIIILFLNCGGETATSEAEKEKVDSTDIFADLSGKDANVKTDDAGKTNGNTDASEDVDENGEDAENVEEDIETGSDVIAEDGDNEGDVEDASSPDNGSDAQSDIVGNDAQDDVQDDAEEIFDTGCTTESPCESPSILTIDPISGGASGGTIITVFGDHFQNDVQVFLDDEALANVEWLSPTQIKATTTGTDLCNLGARTLRVLNPDGGEAKATDAFSYYFDEDPVVFVHGYGAGLPEWEQHWNTMKGFFAEKCYPEEMLFAVRYNDSTGSSIVHARDELAPFIDNVLLTTGSERVDIVAHSMGGLSTRLYIRFYGGKDKVRDYVTLAGAHHGTNIACADLFNEGAKEMCPPYAEGSDSYNDVQILLNGDPDVEDVDETPYERTDSESGLISYMSIYSDFDEIILPHSSSCLNQRSREDCSDPMNVKVTEAIVGHGGIFLSREVFDLYYPHITAHNKSKP